MLDKEGQEKNACYINCNKYFERIKVGKENERIRLDTRGAIRSHIRFQSTKKALCYNGRTRLAWTWKPRLEPLWTTKMNWPQWYLRLNEWKSTQLRSNIKWKAFPRWVEAVREDRFSINAWFLNEILNKHKQVWFSSVHVICSSSICPLLWLSSTEGLNSRMNDKEAHIWTSFKTSCGCVCMSYRERQR